MSEKVKVPKWFDEWYKSFDKSNFITKNHARLYYISRTGFAFLFYDGQDKDMPRECYNYVYKNKEKLIRAILDGYEIEEEYVEITPVEAYERYLNWDFVYFKDENMSELYELNDVANFDRKNDVKCKTKFYIKKES